MQEKWEGTNLIDMIKEVDLENQFTHDFISYNQKIYLKPNEISERSLLFIYGMGTNVGLKHMCAGNAHVSEYQLRYIKNYFLSTDNLKKRAKQSGKRFIQNKVIRYMERYAYSCCR